MKLISWNVNGIRAVLQKGFEQTLNELNPDILCIQETKAQPDQVADALSKIKGYTVCANSAERKGYSGTAILSRLPLIATTNDMGIAEHDAEGRIICAELEQCFVVNVYVPNSGAELARLDYRKQWDIDFCNYLKSLEKRKPVIVCGDFNVAHKPIDIARPKENYDKSAGYTQIEIDGMDRFTSSGFVDTFRHLHPDQAEAYSWWSYRAGARARNIGWRIDYFLMSQSLTAKLSSADIYPQFAGSDHCPIGIEISL